MNAGELRHRVTIQSLALTSDGMGGQTETWTDFLTAWASIEPIKGGEHYSAQQLADGITHRITMRYQAGIAAKQRVKFGTRIFGIRSVINPEERNVRLVLEVGEAL